VTTTSTDVWATAAAYEPYVGRWSRVVARDFIPWLNVDRGASWLDVGCGTGALTESILHLAAPRHVEAIDSSAGFVDYARDRIKDARVAFSVADARQLPQPGASADAVVSALVINFVPEPLCALREMVRVAIPESGVVAAYVWDYASRMDLIRYFWSAAVELDPGAMSAQESRRFPMCNPTSLSALFKSAGLDLVDVRAIDAPTSFKNFEDFWTPFLGGQGPAPGYAMSLSEENRCRLRERLREILPAKADGSIELIARAWAVRGVRPAHA
jgi:SAM-dependent methyltransferase